LLHRGIVSGGDVEELFALYRQVFGVNAMVMAPLYGFNRLARCEDVPSDWIAAYNAVADQDRAPAWLASAPPGSICRASRLPGVGPDLVSEFARHDWADVAISFMPGPLEDAVSMGCYRRGRPFSDEEESLMSMLHPLLSAALGTEAALGALRAPYDETLDGALARFEGHVLVTWPALEIEWSERGRRLWQELLGEPGSPALWARVEDVLGSTVKRFVEKPHAARSTRVFRGVRAEVAAIPPKASEQRRFALLFVREREVDAADVDAPLLRLLGERQRAVVLAAARGRSLKLVAADLGISLETARSHLRSAYRRLGVDSRVELRALLELD
jgi:DNA-binding CsgD family transcriptional regulator